MTEKQDNIEDAIERHLKKKLNEDLNAQDIEELELKVTTIRKLSSK